MKNKLLNQIFVCLAIIGILIPCFIVPAAADAVDKSLVNLLPASGYRYSTSNGSSAVLSKPVLFFDNITSASWRWEAGLNDIGFTGFVVTIQVSNAKAPAHLYMQPYSNGPSVELTKVGSSGDYIQYQMSNAVSLALVTFTGEWSSTYSGRFNIVSFYGILGDLISIPKAARQVLRYTYTSGGFSRGELYSSGAEELPLYLQSDFSSPSADFYDVYNFGIRNSLIPFRYLEEMTFFFATTAPEADVSVYVAEDKNLWSSSVIYKTLPVDLSLSFTADTEYISGRYYNLYYYTATVDLSEVDLSGKMINLTFDSLPVGDNDTVALLYYIAARPPVEEIPWYQVFYNWIKGFWDGETNEIESSISSAADDITSSLNQSLGSMVNGTQNQNNQVSGDVGKLEGGSDQLGQLTQDMQVEKPEISAEDVSVDALIPQAGMNMIAAPILTIWDSPTILSILILVVTLILVSFVFFGKKG